MTVTDPDTQRGLYGKYRVEKVNGKPTGPVFILAYATDRNARIALAAYADACESMYPQLAADLRAELGCVRCDAVTFDPQSRMCETCLNT